jgi:hypothetical protein
MRLLGISVIALSLLLPLAPAAAAERAAVIRASELKAKPFMDAPTSANLAANQQVNVLSRQGAWVQIEAGGASGWVRMLNLRMEAGTAQASAAPVRRGRFSSPTSLFTGSTGTTATTGIKGMDEEDIRNASVNYAELQRLGTLAVQPAEASATAQRNGLKETKVAYLDKGDGK